MDRIFNIMVIEVLSQPKKTFYCSWIYVYGIHSKVGAIFMCISYNKGVVQFKSGGMGK